ncbi:MAG: KH domain-containing protein [Candidatus Woesearchaeota archaeon]
MSHTEEAGTEKEKERDEEKFFYSMKIPLERIPILIGKEGSTKKQLEEETGCSFNINSRDGEVEISSEDSVKLYTAKEIVKAVGRGFNPKIALELLKPDYVLEVIELRRAASSASQINRMKGRVIGAGGKARKTIEQLTDTSISVYGKTISIIGESSDVATAKRAIESLLLGSNHSTVYSWLEKQRKISRAEEIRKQFGVGENDFQEDLSDDF